MDQSRIRSLSFAVGQVYGTPWVRRLIGFYVWFFRGVPLLVLLFLVYFGLFSLMDINLSAFSAALMVLGLISAAYLILTTVAGALLHRLENRLRLPGFDHYNL